MWGNRCHGLYTLQNPYKFTAIFVYEKCHKSVIGNKGKLFSRYFQKMDSKPLLPALLRNGGRCSAGHVVCADGLNTPYGRGATALFM